MIGEFAALATALSWAVAARIFQQLGQSFTALNLNLWKGVFGIVALLLITQANVLTHNYPLELYFWLILSGVIGIGLGDTFFFQALKRIGDSQTILIAETTAPIFTALRAMAWINEWLSWAQWLGVALVLLSVDRVIILRKRNSIAVFSASGYFFAALAALCQALGAVVSRDILTRYAIDPFDASLVRLLGGLFILCLLITATQGRWLPRVSGLSVQQKRVLLLHFVAAVVLGTFAGLYLQMLALTHAKAAVVQTLFATSVILSLLVAKVMGERIDKRIFAWSLMALSGVAILVVLE